MPRPKVAHITKNIKFYEVDSDQYHSMLKIRSWYRRYGDGAFDIAEGIMLKLVNETYDRSYRCEYSEHEASILNELRSEYIKKYRLNGYVQ